MDYIIKKSDTATNGQFTIKPYTTNGPNTPTAAIPLDENAVSANTSLVLLGKGMYQYGEIIAENFVHLLEHFASPIAPVYPIQGQLWYKNDTGELFVYDGSSFAPNVIINGTLTTNLDVNTNKIINVVNPTDPQDAATKDYVDVLGGTFVLKAGDTMDSTANLTFVGGGEVLGLPILPTTGGSATSKTYVDSAIATAGAAFVLSAGDTMTGTLLMSNDAHIVLPTPTGGFVAGDDVVNKDYVDSVVGSSGLFVEKAGDTMTGRLLIDGTTMYSGDDRTVVSVNTGTNTITINGGDFTTDFTIGKQFLAALSATSGYQIVNVGGAVVGGDPTGLANDATVYTATITVDGAPIPITVTGSLAQTYTTLLNEINTDLGITAIATLSGGNILVTSLTSGASSTVAIADVDLFSTLTTYVAILAAVPGVSAFSGVLITLSSVYNAPNTEITTFETLTVASTSGTVSKLPGLFVTNNAATIIDGNLFITGIRTIDMGGNLIQNILDPVSPQDAASKAYVDSITATGDGTLSSVTFTNNTLTFNSTVGAPIVVSNVAEAVHEHAASDIMFDTKSDNNYNSAFRDLLRTTVSTYPSITSQKILETVDSLLYQSTIRPNDRHLITVSTDAVITVSAPLSGTLPFVAFGQATNGYQDVLFAVPKAGGDSTSLLIDTQGYQVVDVGGAVVGADPTGLANDATVYLATVTVDGVAIPISITGSLAQTYTTLLNEINTDLGVAATAALVGGNIRITSATFGVASTVLITDTNLFSTLTAYVAILAAVAGTHPVYTATITVDGVAFPISIDGDNAQTFTDLLNELNTDLGVAATASIVGGNIRITSATTGVTSTIVITAGTLFAAPLADFSSIDTAVNGVKDFITVAGDYTTTFKVGVTFTTSGDSGSPGTLTHQTFSSAFGGINTVISLYTALDLSMVGDGVVDQSYGALEISGNETGNFITGGLINLSGNTNGPSNGNYTLSNVTLNPALTATYLYMASTTPLPAATAADGVITPYTFVMPFSYTTETNKLQVYRQGVKQYNATRAYSYIPLNASGGKLIEWYPTNLVAGSYSFTITVDGGTPQSPSVTVAYTPYTITAVDLVNNSWTVTGAPIGYFKQFSQIEVVNNVGLSSVATKYTIKSVVEGATTTLYVNESINPLADATGQVRYPYSYSNLIDDIRASISTLYPTGAPTIKIVDGKLLIFSPTTGVGSSMTAVDVDLWAAISIYEAPIVNSAVGVDFSYREVGNAMSLSTSIDLQVLPVVGEVYELINTQ